MIPTAVTILNVIASTSRVAKTSRTTMSMPPRGMKSVSKDNPMIYETPTGHSCTSTLLTMSCCGKEAKAPSSSSTQVPSHGPAWATRLRRFPGNDSTPSTCARTAFTTPISTYISSTEQATATTRTQRSWPIVTSAESGTDGVSRRLRGLLRLRLTVICGRQPITPSYFTGQRRLHVVPCMTPLYASPLNSPVKSFCVCAVPNE